MDIVEQLMNLAIDDISNSQEETKYIKRILELLETHDELKDFYPIYDYVTRKLNTLMKGSFEQKQIYAQYCNIFKKKQRRPSQLRNCTTFV